MFDCSTLRLLQRMMRIVKRLIQNRLMFAAQWTADLQYAGMPAQIPQSNRKNLGCRWQRETR
jgi:hypothetical protein